LRERADRADDTQAPRIVGQEGIDLKIAVTGGTGFIGSRVVRILRERGHEVVCVVRDPDNAGALAALGAVLSPGDILDAESRAV
jgi:uncharacterized protein YbjT (DUF2867 family)